MHLASHGVASGGFGRFSAKSSALENAEQAMEHATGRLIRPPCATCRMSFQSRCGAVWRFSALPSALILPNGP
eukprot:8969792-Alexandrium_andersonii.AAC.1